MKHLKTYEQLNNVQIFNTEQVESDKSGKLQDCYENARIDYWRRKNNGEDVQYFMGVIKSSILPYNHNHAWVVKNDIIYDTTPFLKNEYFGDFDLATEYDVETAIENMPDIKYVGSPLIGDDIPCENEKLKYFKLPKDEEFWNKIHNFSRKL